MLHFSEVVKNSGVFTENILEMCQITQCFLLKGFFKQNNTLIIIETLENVVNTEKKRWKIDF